MEIQPILHELCPRCHKGKIFRGPLWRTYLSMFARCSECGLQYEREQGYFLGAMYFSYVLASVILTVFYFVLAALLPDLNGAVLVLVALIPFLPLVPAVFRYSRVLWVYFERAGSPLDDSAGAYEKLRLRQQQQSAIRIDKDAP